MEVAAETGFGEGVAEEAEEAEVEM